MLVTKIVSPLPLSRPEPISMFAVSLKVISDTGAVNESVMFRVVSVSTTAVTCVPVAIPVPPRGAPIGGSVDAPDTPSLVAPLAADPLVAKFPLAPCVTTVNVGDVPIAAPV